MGGRPTQGSLSAEEEAAAGGGEVAGGKGKIVSVGDWKGTPKSPCSTAPIQRRYWTWSGAFSPQSSLIRSMSSAVTLGLRV